MVPLLALNAVGASQWSGLLSLLILISVTSSLSIHIQTAATRVIQAMGQQGVFFLNLSAKLTQDLGLP